MALNYLRMFFLQIFDGGIIQLPYLQISPLSMFFLIIMFIAIEWQTKLKTYPLEDLNLKYNTFKRYCFYYLIIATIFWFGARPQEFIYFQF